MGSRNEDSQGTRKRKRKENVEVEAAITPCAYMHIFAYKCTQLASRKAVLLGAAGAGSLAGCAAFWQENAKKTYRKC